jgi:hypothetical protein
MTGGFAYACCKSSTRLTLLLGTCIVCSSGSFLVGECKNVIGVAKTVERLRAVDMQVRQAAATMWYLTTLIFAAHRLYSKPGKSDVTSGRVCVSKASMYK